MTQPIIQVCNLQKSFGPKKVLTGIDFELLAGESLVIIGGSGSGKSVALKCILGLLEADSGSIKIEGEELVGSSLKTQELALKKIGMLFQGAALFDSLPIWENIAFRLLQDSNISKKDAKELAIELLNSVRLGSHVAELFPAELSGGMQRRVGLARAIASKPRILFFDEPTAGLDPMISGVITELIAQCVEKLGATAITITHDMKCAKRIGGRIAMLYQGKIQWIGPAEEIDHCGNPYIEQFIEGRSEGPIILEVNR